MFDILQEDIFLYSVQSIHVSVKITTSTNHKVVQEKKWGKKKTQQIWLSKCATKHIQLEIVLLASNCATMLTSLSFYLSAIWWRPDGVELPVVTTGKKVEWGSESCWLWNPMGLAEIY